MEKGVDFIGVGVVFYCHDGNGNVLLNKRNSNCKDEHGSWDIGGGGLEFGEQVTDALKREIEEEYCTDVKEYEFLGFRDVHRAHGGVKTHWIALDFKVLINKDKFGNGEPHKFDEIRWFKKDELSTPMHSQWPEFLRKYKDKL